jgi:hypothetical protein
MPSTEDQRLPVAGAYRLATGHEPPAALDDERRRDFDARVESAWEDARRIYGARGA